MRGLSLVVASGGHSSSRCAGLSLSWPLLMRSTGSRHAGSAAVAHGPSCSVACGILPDQGSNPCPLHWQADSQPLRHQGSPLNWVLNKVHMLHLIVISFKSFLNYRFPIIFPLEIFCWRNWVICCVEFPTPKISLIASLWYDDDNNKISSFIDVIHVK